MMIPTRNDLREETRSQVCKFLNGRLSEAIDLVYQSKQAHWNVKGMNFRSLHKLFDQVAESTEEYVDLFAERIVQLGGIAEGTVQAASRGTSLAEYPLEPLPDLEHVNRICDNVASFGKQVRQGIQFCDDAGDAVTADILTEAARGIDELTWMLESHLIELRRKPEAAPEEKRVTEAA